MQRAYMPASERACVCVPYMYSLAIRNNKKETYMRESERAREDAAPLHSLTCGRDICMEYCIKIEQPKTSLFPTPPEPPQAKAASLLPIQNFIFNSAFPFSFFSLSYEDDAAVEILLCCCCTRTQSCREPAAFS
jgi:hypothetical protein